MFSDKKENNAQDINAERDTQKMSNEINAIVNQEIGKDKPLELSEDSVHVMPAKFLPQSPKKQLSSKQKIIFVSIVFVLFLGFVIAAMLWWASSSVTSPTSNTPVVNNTDTNTENNTTATEAKNDQKILEDIIIFKAALDKYFQFEQKYPVYLGDLQPKYLTNMPLQKDGSAYIYAAISNGVNFKFTVQFDGSVDKNKVGTYQFTKAGWAVYQAEVESENNNANNNPVAPPPPPVIDNTDTDKDNLTREEEGLLGTNVNDSDTDNDGYQDGTEVLNLYNPSVSSGSLADSGVVTIFTNDEFKYRLFYPSAWVADILTDANHTVAISTDTELGDNFSLLVSNNADNATLSAWANDTSLHPKLENTSTVTLGKNKIAALKQEIDGDIWLVAVTTSHKIVIRYDVNDQAERYFDTIFQMMLNSFEFFNA